MNTHIAVKSSRLVMHVLRDAPPSVHPRGVLLVFVLRSKVRRSQEEFYLYTHLGGGGGGRNRNLYVRGRPRSVERSGSGVFREARRIL